MMDSKESDDVIHIAQEYDPSYLRGLRQPQPNDLPGFLEPGLFTFEDALDDLVCAHYEGDIQDIRTLHANRMLSGVIFPHGEPPGFQKLRFALGGHDWRIDREAAATDQSLLGQLPLHHVAKVFRMSREDESANFDSILSHVMGLAPGLISEMLSRDREPRDETDLAEHVRHHSKEWPSPFEVIRHSLPDKATPVQGGGKTWTESYSENFDSCSSPSRSTFTSRTDSDGRTTEVTRTSQIGSGGQFFIVQSTRIIDSDGKIVHTDRQVFEDEHGWTQGHDKPAEPKLLRHHDQDMGEDHKKSRSWFWK